MLKLKSTSCTLRVRSLLPACGDSLTAYTVLTDVYIVQASFVVTMALNVKFSLIKAKPFLQSGPIIGMSNQVN